MSDTPETDKMASSECSTLQWLRFTGNLERERNQARQERDELKDALDTASEYIYEALMDYDSAFNRHRATAQGSKAISNDLEKVRSLLEKLKEPKSEIL